MPSMATTHGGVLYYVVKVPKDSVYCTDSGWDNPFRPGGDLSREADEIVELIKGGKPITPTSGGNASPTYLLDQTDAKLELNNVSLQTSSPTPLATKQANEPITESPKKVNNDLHATPKNATNGNVQNDTKPGALDVQRGTIIPQAPVDANQVEHVVIKKKPKCKCCVIQ
ncbi:hypothetical protein QE152_g5661 [Popillia japonica]|uniref:Uncharacterized protein n=1 Tax=Popillia japonica TaxID=7064 RepID=A0AAW1MKY1_POPJA